MREYLTLLVPGNLPISIHWNETQNHLEYLEDAVWWGLRDRREDVQSCQVKEPLVPFSPNGVIVLGPPNCYHTDLNELKYLESECNVLHVVGI